MRALPFLAALSLVLGGCGGNRPDTPPETVPVVVAVAAPARFVAPIDVVGTALPNEQAVLSSPATQRIVRLNVTDGAYVRAGQVVAELARGGDAEALAEAEARQAEAERRFRRLEALRLRGFATRKAIDAQAAELAAAQAQAQVLRGAVGDALVRAPLSGFVALGEVTAGAVVTAGAEIATISDTSRIRLAFAVPETLVARLTTGQRIRAIAAAYPDQPFAGSVIAVDPVAAPESRAVMVRALLPNREGLLRPGMLLTVAVGTRPRMALAVPERAILGDGAQRFLFVAGERDIARRVAVRTGMRQNGVVEIVDGLGAGQRVVTEGAARLTDGAALRLTGSTPAS